MTIFSEGQGVCQLFTKLCQKEASTMSKISKLIMQLEFAQQLLEMQMKFEQTRLTQEFVMQLAVAYQKVSLAEKHGQVKNACSHMSSTNE